MPLRSSAPVYSRTDEPVRRRALRMLRAAAGLGAIVANVIRRALAGEAAEDAFEDRREALWPPVLLGLHVARRGGEWVASVPDIDVIAVGSTAQHAELRARSMAREAVERVLPVRRVDFVRLGEEG